MGTKKDEDRKVGDRKGWKLRGAETEKVWRPKGVETERVDPEKMKKEMWENRKVRQRVCG